MNHHSLRWQRLCLVFVTTLFGPVTPGQEPETGVRPALRGLDPVALCRGEEQAGQATLQLTHGAYTYRFATAASQATFRADPERYAIQWGGACARMGPLSGVGDDDRWLVHEQRIYIFASNACRDGFAKRAAQFLPEPAPAPSGDAEALARGAELLAAAVTAHGGAERLRQWRSYRHQHNSSDGDTRQERRLSVRLPQTVRSDHDWMQGDKTWRFHRVFTATSGFFVSDTEVRDMHAVARREARETLLREPAFALRAALDGKPVVTALGKREVAGLQVEEFSLWLDDCLTTFGVDAEGRVRTARYRGRGPGLWFGEVVKVYDDYTEVAGLSVPRSVSGSFDGAPAPSFREQRTDVTVDAELDPSLFARPR